jgi:hypothetical protein
MAKRAAWDRLGALSGVLAGLLMAAGFMLGDPYDPATDPDPTDPSPLLARALIDNRDEARLGAYLGLAGVFLLFWFLGRLYRQLREAESAESWLALVAFGGGLAAGGVVLVGMGFLFAASELSSFGDDTSVAKVIVLWGWNSASLLAPPLAALVVASTVSAFRFGALARWVAWFGAVMVLALVATTVLGTPGLGAAIGLLWMVVASVGLLFTPTRSRREAVG